MSPHKTLLLVVILSISYHVTSHNITQILSTDPNLSQFNSLLSQTKLDDEINSRTTITVLALPNSAISSFITPNLSLSAIKNILSLHILLDYYDSKKLHNIKNGTVLTTTLYQTTGQAHSQVGELNITDVKGGDIKFGSAQPGAKLGPTFVKDIKQIPFSLSVIQITAPIIVPDLITESSANVNVTAVLDKAGCKIFSALLASSGVLKTYENAVKTGITVFAPNDEAFKAKNAPDLKGLSSADVVSLLQFHALDSYAPIGTLKSSKGNLQTLAPAGKYALTTSTAGDAVTLHTGVDSSRIATTLLDSTPVAIYSVDSVLLPVALFGMSPAPAPAPESDSPASAPAPTADTPAPSKAPSASPPAPPMGTPAGAPSDEADAPTKAAEEKSKNGGGELMRGVAVSVACGVILLLV